MSYKLLIISLVLVISPSLYIGSACNVPDCNTCYPINGNICIICNAGFNLSKLKCVGGKSNTSCTVKHCSKCLAGKCVSCVNNYKLNNFLNCVPTSCSDVNCDQCSKDRNICENCKLGYFVSLNVCVSKCSSTRCLTCKDNRCTQCLPGFTYMTGKFLFNSLFRWLLRPYSQLFSLGYSRSTCLRHYLNYCYNLHLHKMLLYCC